MTWPLAANIGERLPGMGDALLQTWLLAWNAHALASDPLRIWDAPIFYPYPTTAAYHDHHLIQSLVAAPLIWLTDNPIFAYNLLIILSFALSGWAASMLAGELSGNRMAGFLAGAGFAFCAYQFSHITQLNILQTAWLPWAMLFLHRLLRPHDMGGGRLPDALLCGLSAGMLAANAVYYAFFGVVLMLGYGGQWLAMALYAQVRRRSRLPWRQLGMACVAAGLALVIAGPFFLPYLAIYRSLGIVRSFQELDNWSAPLRAYVSVTAENRLYAPLGEAVVDSGEMVLFPGLTIAILGLIGGGMALWRLRAAPQANPFGPAQVFWVLSAGAAFVLSLGTAVRLVRFSEPLPIPTPYALLYSLIPGFSAMRVPSRWGMIVTLALCVLAAIALAALFRRVSPRAARVLAGLGLVLILSEQWVAPLSLSPPLRPQIAAVYHWLGEPAQADIEVLLELPVDPLQRGDELTRTVWRHFSSMAHWKQLPVAYSGLMPIGTLDLLRQVQNLPDPATVRYLQLLGVDTLLLHRDEYEPATLAELEAGLAATPGVQLRADRGDTVLYSLAPDERLAELDAQIGSAAADIYISNDERVPGMPALALSRRWAAQGYQVYGPDRVRYYADLVAPRFWQVFDYGLFAEAEDPGRFGFSSTGLLWRDQGLAMYRREPELSALLELGLVDRGMFHPRYPRQLDLTRRATELALADWGKLPLIAGESYVLELTVAALTPTSIQVAGSSLAIPAGRSVVELPLPPDGSFTLGDSDGDAAFLQLRLRRNPAVAAQVRAEEGMIAQVESGLAGSSLVVAVQAAGVTEVQLDIRGAATRDERPIRLLSGAQAVGQPGAALVFETDLRDPQASWISASEAAEDGRYIAYVRNAATPAAPGQAIAKFNIRAGQIVDFEAVPLPLGSVP